MASLIFTIRRYIPRGLEEGTLGVRITCSNCLDEHELPFEYDASVPSAETVSRAIASGPKPFLVYVCPRCHIENVVDSRTFLPTRRVE